MTHRHEKPASAKKAVGIQRHIRGRGRRESGPAGHDIVERAAPAAPTTAPLTPADREQLILGGMEHVHKCATIVARGLPRSVDIEELVAAGNLGLCQAANRYHGGPVLFGRFAQHRIFGAMQDHLRYLDLATAQERRNAKADETTVDRRWLVQLDKGNRPKPARFDSDVENRHDIEYLLTGLPERLDFVIRRYLRDETQLECGARIGVGESRVSQLEAEALTLIRQRYSDARVSSRAA
jgi:RNA polymerase sigma factor (sigma-70 family)